MIGSGPLLRGAAVWLAVTAAATAGVHRLGSEAVALRHGAGTAGLEVLLVRGCAAAVLVCLAWGWLVTSAVLVEAVAGVRAGPAVPAAVRRAVLAACGLALAGGLGAPAAVADGVGPAGEPDAVGRGGGPAALDGLPLPDRALGGAGAPGRPASGAAHRGADVQHLTVRAGDSLWAIASRDLPPAATHAAIAARVGAIHELNRVAIGPDPNLVHPGQRLRLPR